MKKTANYVWPWVISIALVRLIAHILVADQYGFHRDEYLYLAQTEHLAWGFIEVPPALAVCGAFMRLFGDGIIWIKFFPAMIGAVMVILMAKMTSDLGGGRWAQIFAASAFAVVPTFLRTQHLFQPVALNQFMWTLMIFFVIRLISTQNKNYWYAIGATIGVGMLTKYSIVFPVTGLVLGLALTPSRHWLRMKEPWLAAALALLIFWPNLVWQYNHNWPVINHMRELNETQLVNVQPGFFIGMQFLMLLTASLLWVPGVVALFSQKFLRFRSIGWMFVVTFAIILILSGKPYYTLGVYPVVIASGAIWWESILANRRGWRIALTAYVIIGALPIVPYGIPIFPIEQMESYCSWMSDNFGLNAPLMWEDGIQRPIPQDYADMFGWEECVANLSDYYHMLPKNIREDCNIWGGSYGHAGALLYYAEEYELPRDITSFNGSFALWAKDEAEFSCQLIVDDNLNLSSSYFANSELIDSNSNRFARDPGYVIFRSEPIVDVPSTWRQLVVDQKSQWQRSSSK